MWTIEMHGGSQRSKWRAVGKAEKVEQATKQAKALLDRASQGGVRVLTADGIIIGARWLRHAPGAKPEPMTFCIGCGCDDFHACVDVDNGGPCSWIRKDADAPHGVCSCCSDALKRWDAGDRRVPA